MRTSYPEAVRRLDAMSFRHDWRPYQQRVLEAVDKHLSDSKLHVVAPPGSGKTSLGLEIFRRLGQPAVIFSPTRTIRDQWLSRLRDFHPQGDSSWRDWTSTSLDHPGFLTSLTYQALHARSRRAEEISDEEEANLLESAPSLPRRGLEVVVRRLRAHGVRTLILDEAHHLRQEWWKVLAEILNGLEGARVVSLTATPPYDVIGPQWRRYEQLCGPIDEEISVPELVRSGTLCPHQDYIWAVLPAAADQMSVREFEAAVNRTLAELSTDFAFADAVKSHPWIASAHPDTLALLGNLELAMGLAIFLRETGSTPPEGLLKALDCREDELPEIDPFWWSVLLRHYLFGETWTESEARREHRDDLARRLRKSGLLWRRELRLEKSRPLQRKLSLTAAKIDACVQINRLEREVRQRALCQVILTDFIRQEGEGAKEVLGAWPIFRALTDSAAPEHRPRIALLTGPLALIHQKLVPFLERRTDKGLVAKPLDANPEFAQVLLNGGGSPLVKAFTRLLVDGELDTLIGTRSLLGEGWDAPAVNSLVLASFVGSYVLTNQMRGRAIRTDPRRPDKCSSIWHLVAIDPTRRSGLEDLHELRRRFETFVGLAHDRPTIESGVERLQLPACGGPDFVDGWNREFAGRLSQEGDLAARWREAIGTSSTRVSRWEPQLLPSIGVPRPPPPRPVKMLPYFFGNTLRHSIGVGLGLLSAAGGFLLRGASTSDWALTVFLWVVGGCLAVISLVPFLRSLRLWLRHLPVDGSLRQIGWAVGEALVETRLIQPPPSGLSIRVDQIRAGGYAISLASGTFYEKSVFSDCVAEVLGPVDNPRYLVTRTAFRRKGYAEDYHSVPFLLASNKRLAEVFHRCWRRRVGPSQLVYTRSEEGKAILLKAKTRAFSAAFARQVKRYESWR